MENSTDEKHFQNWNKNNKMELLQSQAPCQDLQLQLDMGLLTLDIRHWTWDIGNIEEKLFSEGTK